MGLLSFRTDSVSRNRNGISSQQGTFAIHFDALQFTSSESERFRGYRRDDFTMPEFLKIRYRLLQVRDSDDPMCHHEVQVFARALKTTPDMIDVFDLLHNPLTDLELKNTDMFLLGGSGDYSAAGEGEWLQRALDSLRLVHNSNKPTFASCWGFQAMARAMGGQVIHDLAHSELGTHQLSLTDEGKTDPVFSPLGDCFLAQMGHEDYVVELPPGAICLASSDRVQNQAFRFADAPIYCTQFHPELSKADLLVRLECYPKYVEKIARIPFAEFVETLRETKETEELLPRLVAQFFDD